MELTFTELDLLHYAVADEVGVEDLKKRLAEGETLRVKLGIDATSSDIHLGRSIVIWRLRAFQELGHHIELIIGDFTGQIGDTSDKEAERPMLDEETVKQNLARYEEQLWLILNPAKKELVTFHYNSTWLAKLTLAEVSHMADAFSVNQFIKRELIARRLEAGSRISLREMLYPLMQGYDSLMVEADVELGGTDQWFNLLAGRTLQEQAGKRPQAVIVNPLISGTDGRKMSSSYGNGIYLLDSPTEKFGKFMTIRDELLADFLLIFPRCIWPFSAEELEQRIAQGENPRDLKLQLAELLVALYHGEQTAAETRTAYIHQFSEGQLPTDIPEVSLGVVTKPVVELLVEHGLASSKTEARLLIQQGGVRFAGEVITTPEATVTTHSGSILNVGKRRFLRFL